jgi:hypothetical protein
VKVLGTMYVSTYTYLLGVELQVGAREVGKGKRKEGGFGRGRVVLLLHEVIYSDSCISGREYMPIAQIAIT